MIRLFCLLFLAGALSVAAAQTRVYQWTDREGVVHFSTEPPPASTAGVEERTLDEAPRPGSVAPSLPQAAEEPEEIASEEPAVDPEQVASEREAACRRGRELIALIEPSFRVNVTRADGTTEILTGDDRIRELDAARRLVEENCN